MQKLVMLVLATAAALTAAAAPARSAQADGNIVETAAAAGNFKTLLAATQAAGLAETLAEAGPFTVFAPTDAAFAKLPEGTVDALLQDPEQLRSILLYHVVAGAVPASEAVKLETAKTLNGARVGLEVKDGDLFVNDAKVIATDVMATNGVIHAIDSVLLPPGNAIEVATQAGSFRTLSALLKQTGLDQRLLEQKGPFTIFAPTDAAFAKVPKATMAALQKDSKLLRRVLAYHVRVGDLDSTEVAERKGLWTVARRVLDVRPDGTTLRVDDARIVAADIPASNGVIHAIDSVLVPRV